MGPQNQSGCFRKEKGLLTLPQIKLLCLWPSPSTDYIMQMSNLDLVECYALKRSRSQDHFMYLKVGL